MFYWSNREGASQIYRLDLKSGESKQLTNAAALDTTSFAVSSDDRYLYYFDGAGLQSLTLSTLKPREIHKMSDTGARRSLAVASDGSILCLDNSRIVRIALQKANALPGTDRADLILARPRRAQIAWRSGNSIWLAATDGSARKQLALAPGAIGETLWSPQGHTLLYLRQPDDPKQLTELRECNPDDGTDKLVARTSQFGTFAPNGDASVFAGASRSKASAYVLLLLRVTRRELTLCEHRASDPSMVSVVFAPDSQSIFFVSDRHGKPAIYRVPVEKFVEETPDQ